MELLLLFVEFFKTGLFALGGGLATLPFLYNIADKYGDTYGWFTRDMIPDMLAISESTPGPIGVNMATYAGYNAAGVLGGVIATLGLVLPSVIIILIVARVLQKVKGNVYVENAFYGIRPAVCGIIAAAGFDVIKNTLFAISKYVDTNDILDLFNIKAILLFLVLLFFTNKYKKHPIVYIAIAAIVGIVFKFA